MQATLNVLTTPFSSFFNILSILILSMDPKYLLIQSPWLGGSGLSIFLDAILLWRIGVWQKRWKERKGTDGETGAQKDAERAARLAKLDEEKAELVEEWEIQDMHEVAYGPAPTQKEGESDKAYKRRLHAHAVARKDYLAHADSVADIKGRGERRGASLSLTSLHRCSR